MTTTSKTVLFVAYGGGHVGMVIPVINALQERASRASCNLKIKILGLPAAKPILDQQGMESFTYLDYLGDDDKDAIAWGNELAKQHHSPTSGIEENESIAYLGLNYKDLVLRLGEAQASAELTKKGRHAFYPLTIMERIFDDIKPDFVVTTNSPRSEAAAIAVANQRGIDNLIITDLFTGLGDYLLRGQNISFLNRAARDTFEKDGLVDPELSHFHYTGNPAFDKLLTLPNEKSPGGLEQHFPGINGKPVVLHADMPAYWDPINKTSHFKSETEILDELEAVYQSCIDNGAVYLVRPHPSQQRQLYSHWLEGRKDAYLAADPDLHELLRNMSLLVVRTSTVGLEAVYMLKRVLQLDSSFHKDLPLAKMGVAWGVDTYDELSTEMASALKDNEQLVKIKSRIKELFPFEPAADKLARIVQDKLFFN